MSKDVMISIVSDQTGADAQTDRITLMTQGTLTDLGGALELSYDESEVTGMEGTSTTLVADKTRITLLRTGQVCSQMVFEQGRRHLSVYSTPYGDLEVTVSTSRLVNELTQAGGRIEIDYSTEVNHALVGVNAFRISVRENG